MATERVANFALSKLRFQQGDRPAAKTEVQPWLATDVL